MKEDFLRQVQDIQVQAQRIEQGHPTINEVEGFKKYVDEMKSFIQENISIPEILTLESEIPSIPKNRMNLKKGLISYFAPAFSQYFHERSYIEESKEYARTIKGKFASIAFISKNIPEREFL